MPPPPLASPSGRPRATRDNDFTSIAGSVRRSAAAAGPRTCRQLLPEAASILADTRRQPVLEIAGDLEMKIFGGGCSCGRLAKAAAPASLSASIVQIHRVLVACSGLLQAQPLGLLIDRLVGIRFEQVDLCLRPISRRQSGGRDQRRAPSAAKFMAIGKLRWSRRIRATRANLEGDER